MNAQQLETIKGKISNLIRLGVAIRFCEISKQKGENREFSIDGVAVFRSKDFDLLTEYQRWYARALRTVETFARERLDEFKDLYKKDRRSNQGLTDENFCISDYLMGLVRKEGGKVVEDYSNAFHAKFHLQIGIIESIKDNLNDTLFNVNSTLQANIFDNELDAAKELVKNGYFRAAGMLAGVPLEMHLKSVCMKHGITLRKKNLTAADFNDALKKENVIEVSTWRNIQYLSDIRNNCTHPRKTEPKKESINDLISGVDKIIKTVF